MTCCLHLLNSAAYKQVTGKPAPPAPVSASTYEENGGPYFAPFREPKVGVQHDAFAALKAVQPGPVCGTDRAQRLALAGAQRQHGCPQCHQPESRQPMPAVCAEARPDGAARVVHVAVRRERQDS
jgi:hypothetical protein